MEVLVGPTFGIDVSSAAAAGGFITRRSAGGDDPTDVAAREIGSGLGEVPLSDGVSESSSSIGAPGDTDDDDDDDDDEVSSKGDGKISRKFGSLGSLEDALPIKRGLSNHFTGKSKSFANLSEVVCSVNNVKEVEKQENPFNKRRRILIHSRLARKSFYSSFNPKSMPLLPIVDENDDSDQDGEVQQHQQQEGRRDDDDDEEDCESELSSTSSSEDKQQQQQQHGSGRGQQMMQYRFQKFHDRKLGGFKSHSCFSLSDLQEEEDDD